MIPLTDDGHCSRGLGSDKSVDGRVLKFPSTSPDDLRVTVYDPSRGVPVVELEVLKKVSYATGKHVSIDSNLFDMSGLNKFSGLKLS